jgi:hypothetical protein
MVVFTSWGKRDWICYKHEHNDICKFKAIVKQLFFQNICQQSYGGNFVIFKSERCKVL